LGSFEWHGINAEDHADLDNFLVIMNEILITPEANTVLDLWVARVVCLAVYYDSKSIKSRFKGGHRRINEEKS
jgi:hypothetical protein